jgi:hypothetical protein
MKSRIILSILLITLAGCTNLPTSSRQPAVAPSNTPTPAQFHTPTAPPAPAQSPTPTAPPTATRILTSTPIPTPDFEALSAIFSYDVSAPLDVTWGAERNDDLKGMADVQEVSYQGTQSCPAGALFVRPRGDGPFPAVIYLHRIPANRNQFLDEAIELAGHGVVSLLLDSPFDRRCFSLDVYTRQSLIDTVIFIRRAIDFLDSLPQVDSTRLAYVGHSFGANFGGVVAGVDARIHFFVLMAGVANLSRYNTPDIKDVDAFQYISHADDDLFLFQFGSSDEYITKPAALNYYNAASGKKSILWYQTDHQGVQYEGQADRVAWLLQQLGIPGK